MDTTPLDVEAARSLLAGAGLDPRLASQPDHDLAMALRLAIALGQRLDLDMPARAALLHYLHRIDQLEHRLRSLHPASVPAVRKLSDGPAPWHEPHG